MPTTEHCTLSEPQFQHHGRSCSRERYPHLAGRAGLGASTLGLTRPLWGDRAIATPEAHALEPLSRRCRHRSRHLLAFAHQLQRPGHAQRQEPGRATSRVSARRHGCWSVNLQEGTSFLADKYGMRRRQPQYATRSNPAVAGASVPEPALLSGRLLRGAEPSDPTISPALLRSHRRVFHQGGRGRPSHRRDRGRRGRGHARPRSTTSTQLLDVPQVLEQVYTTSPRRSSCRSPSPGSRRSDAITATRRRYPRVHSVDGTHSIAVHQRRLRGVRPSSRPGSCAKKSEVRGFLKQGITNTSVPLPQWAI